MFIVCLYLFIRVRLGKIYFAGQVIAFANRFRLRWQYYKGFIFSSTLRD